MLKLENSIRGLSFSRVAFDLTIQAQIPKEQREQTTRLLIHIHNRMAKKPIANFIDSDYIQ